MLTRCAMTAVPQAWQWRGLRVFDVFGAAMACLWRLLHYRLRIGGTLRKVKKEDESMMERRSMEERRYPWWISQT